MNQINWNVSYTEKTPTFSITFYAISPIKKHNDAGFEYLRIGINISSCNLFPNPINYFLLCNVYTCS